MLIVGRVAGLREHLRWFDERPLFGRRIVVTRSREQAAELVEMLEERGADAIQAPTIRIAPPEDPDALDRACAMAGDATTGSCSPAPTPSTRSCGGCSRIGDIRDLKGVRICAIGPSTARAHLALRDPRRPDARREPRRSRDRRAQADGRPDGSTRSCCRAPTSRARCIADELRAARRRGHRGRSPTARCSPAPSATATTTSTACCSIARSTPSRSRAHRRSGTSPRSSARSRPPISCSTTVVASIGPVTAEAAQQLGIETHVMPKRYTIPDLVDALVEHFSASAEPAMTTRSRGCQDPTLDSATPASPPAPHGGACARWCAKRGCRRTTFSIRCSCAAAKASGAKSASMPGVFQLSVDEAVKEAAAAKAEGVPGVLLFGLPDTKDVAGSAAYDPEAPVQSAVRALKREVPDLLVVTDVCLCEYTSHGHCGILVDDEIDNDATVAELVARGAVARRRRRRHRRAVRHDGRPRRSHPRRTRRRAASARRRHHVLRGEVLLGVLRTVPRSRRLGARVRRPPLPSDGPGEHERSAARGRSSISTKGPTSSW